MRFIGVALVSSAIVLGACGGGDKKQDVLRRRQRSPCRGARGSTGGGFPGRGWHGRPDHGGKTVERDQDERQRGGL